MTGDGPATPGTPGAGAELDVAQPTGTQPDGARAHAPEPHLRVVRGAPDPDELVALVAGLSGSDHEDHEEPAGPSRWAAGARTRRRPGRPGPDAWRWSSR